MDIRQRINDFVSGVKGAVFLRVILAETYNRLRDPQGTFDVDQMSLLHAMWAAQPFAADMQAWISSPDVTMQDREGVAAFVLDAYRAYVKANLPAGLHVMEMDDGNHLLMTWRSEMLLVGGLESSFGIEVQIRPDIANLLRCFRKNAHNPLSYDAYTIHGIVPLGDLLLLPCWLEIAQTLHARYVDKDGNGGYDMLDCLGV